MLNEDKINIMTGIAMFEKKEGKRISPANQYFRGDYISSHLIRSFFSYVICYLLGTLIWMLYSIDGLLDLVDTDAIIAMGERYILFFVLGLIAYLFFTYVIFSRRFDFANRENKIYLAKLKRLDKRYEFQTKTKELAKESKGGQPR